MERMRYSTIFRIISLVLVITFVSLDVSYAYPPDDAASAALAAPLLSQASRLPDGSGRSQASILNEGAIIASIFDIAGYFFPEDGSDAKALPSEYASGVVKTLLGRLMDEAGVEILNIVPVGYLRKKDPGALSAALRDIGFDRPLPSEEVIFVLYRKLGERFLIQIAERSKLSPADLPGYDRPVSDRYVVKYIPEDYAQGPGRVAKKDLRDFGKTGLRFFIMGFGSVWFGRRWPPTNKSYAYPSQQKVDSMLLEAFKRLGNNDGVMMIDTAAAYGLSEEKLGAFFRSNPDLYRKAFICTKWGEEFDIATEKPDIKHTLERLTSSVDRSLSRLGRIDLLYIHGTKVDVLKDRAVVDKMARMRRERYAGIRYIGASISDDAVLETALKENLLSDFDVIQVPAPTVIARPDLMSAARDKGLAIVVNSPQRKNDGRELKDIFADLVRCQGVSVILTGTSDVSHLEDNIRYVTEPALPVAGAERIFSSDERVAVNNLGRTLIDFLAVRSTYDVASADRMDIQDEDSLDASGPYDLMLVHGSSDERVAKEAASLAARLRGKNPDMIVMTSGKWGTHNGVTGLYRDAAGRQISEAERFREIMESLGVRVDLVETLSENTGDNIRFSRDILSQRGIRPARIILVQFPALQLRAGRSAETQYPADGQTLASMGLESITSYSPYVPDFSVMNDAEAAAQIGVILSELRRLRGYSGRFMTPVWIPPAVVSAEEALKRMGMTEEGRLKRALAAPLLRSHVPAAAMADAKRSAAPKADEQSAAGFSFLSKHSYSGLAASMEADVARELSSNPGLTRRDMFILVNKQVHETLLCLEYAFRGLFYLSEKEGATTEEIASAIETARSKHSLTDDEVGVLWVAFTGKAQPGTGGDTSAVVYVNDLAVSASAILGSARKPDEQNAEGSGEFKGSRFYALVKKLAMTFAFHRAPVAPGRGRDISPAATTTLFVIGRSVLKMIWRVVPAGSAQRRRTISMSFKTYREIGRFVKELGYSDEVAGMFIDMVGVWTDAQGKPVVAKWAARLKQARRGAPKGDAAARQLVEAEEAVALELTLEVKKNLRSDDNRYDLVDVLEGKAANCLGKSMVIYIIANAIGLPVSILESEVAGYTDAGEGKHHANCMFRLSDGQVMIADASLGSFISKPFRLDREFAPSGALLRVKEASAITRVMCVSIRVLDAKGVIAAVHNNRGDDLNRSGRPHRAIASLDKAIEYDPASSMAHNNRGVAFVMMGDHERAASDFNRSIQLGASSVETYHNRGTAYLRIGRYAEAIADFDVVLGITPKDVATYSNRGTAHGKLGHHAQALADYDRALELDPHDANLYANRAIEYFNAGEYARTVADLTKALQLAPRHAELYIPLGTAYSLLGSADMSKWAFETATMIEPRLSERVQRQLAHLRSAQRPVSGAPAARKLATILAVALVPAAAMAGDAPGTISSAVTGFVSAHPVFTAIVAIAAIVIGLILEPLVKSYIRFKAYLAKADSASAADIYEAIGCEYPKARSRAFQNIARLTDVNLISGLLSLAYGGNSDVRKLTAKLLFSKGTPDAISVVRLAIAKSLMGNGLYLIPGNIAVALSDCIKCESDLEVLDAFLKDNIKFVSGPREKTGGELVVENRNWQQSGETVWVPSYSQSINHDFSALESMMAIPGELERAFAQKREEYAHEVSVRMARERILTKLRQEVRYFIYEEHRKLTRYPAGEGVIDIIHDPSNQAMDEAAYEILDKLSGIIASEMRDTGFVREMLSGACTIDSRIVGRKTYDKDVTHEIPQGHYVGEETRVYGRDWVEEKPLRVVDIPAGVYDIKEHRIMIDRTKLRGFVEGRSKTGLPVAGDKSLTATVPSPARKLATILAVALVPAAAMAGDAPGTISSAVTGFVSAHPVFTAIAAFVAGAISILTIWRMIHPVSWHLYQTKYLAFDGSPIRDLAKLGAPVVPDLITALRSKDPRISEGAAQALCLIGDQRAITPLIGALRGKDDMVGSIYAGALGRIGAPAAEPLIGLLRDPDPDVRSLAALALQIIGLPALEPLDAAAKKALAGPATEADETQVRMVITLLRILGKQLKADLKSIEDEKKNMDYDKLLYKVFRADFDAAQARVDRSYAGFPTVSSNDEPGYAGLAAAAEVKERVSKGFDYDQELAAYTVKADAEIRSLKETIGRIDSLIKDPRTIGILTKGLNDSDARDRRGSKEALKEALGLSEADAAAEFEVVSKAVAAILQRNGDISHAELFKLVRTLVSPFFKGVTAALDELKPLSEKPETTADDISAAINGAKAKHRLTDAETRILWLAFTGPGQGIGATEEASGASLPARSSTEALFDLVESADLGRDGPFVRLIYLARKAKRENQKLIIGLETDWIPAIKDRRSLQSAAIAGLMKEIESIGETLASMGLDNVLVIKGSPESLAREVALAAEGSKTEMDNVLIMASKSTIYSADFEHFKRADIGKRPFLVGIDPSELIRSYEEHGDSSAKQLHIKIKDILYQMIELASGDFNGPPKIPMVFPEANNKRLVIFMPKAEPMDYEKLKSTYMAERAALAAA